MVGRLERIAWLLVAAVLVTFAVPWFWWGSDRLVLGVPAWVVYHVVWLVLASLAFGVFANRAWGLFITGGEPA
ncbi:MAG: DUF3311 domain-containing protein [Halobacteriales archaeon]